MAFGFALGWGCPLAPVPPSLVHHLAGLLRLRLGGFMLGGFMLTVLIAPVYASRRKRVALGVFNLIYTC